MTTVINNTILLVRRINELQRRRDNLVERQESMRRSLPDWTFAPLQLVGMSGDEIRGMMSDLSRAESDAGIVKVDSEIEQIDEQIEHLENMLLNAPSQSLESIQAVLELAINRFSAHTVTDPTDVFYDYGDARVMRLLEHASDDLRALLTEDQRQAS